MTSHTATWTTWEQSREALQGTHIVVLAGGRSSEREVSLDSSRGIVDALTQDACLPASVTLVEIDTDGRWVVGGEALGPQLAVEQLPPDALYFFGLHGGEGENGTLQAFLEICGMRYTGSGTRASAICLDKARARILFEDAGCRVSPARYITPRDWRMGSAAVLDEVTNLTSGTWYVKPNCGGSSVTMFAVTSAGELSAAIESVLATGDDVLVEAGVPGIEVTCGVIGNQEGELTLLPVVEVHPHEGRFFDYEEKYSESGAVEICPPENLSRQMILALGRHALAAYRAAGCDGYARIDFMVPEMGAPVILEANTLPGFTSRSLLPLAAAETGVDFRSLCLELCALAITRQGEPT
jgi:D-alanine-D-alanine ligase